MPISQRKDSPSVAPTTGYVPIVQREPVTPTTPFDPKNISTDNQRFPTLLPEFSQQVAKSTPMINVPDYPDSPSVFSATGGILKDAGQSMARNLASFIGSETFSPVVNRITNAVSNAEKKSDFIKFFNESLAERLYGDVTNQEPVEITGETRSEQLQPVGERIVKFENVLEKKREEYNQLLKTPGLSVNERMVLETLSAVISENKGKLAPLIVGGLVELDLTGFGFGGKNGMKTLYKTIAKTDVIGDAMILAKRIGINDDLIPAFARDVVNAKNVKQGETVINKYIDLQMKTKSAVKNSYIPIVGSTASKTYDKVDAVGNIVTRNESEELLNIVDKKGNTTYTSPDFKVPKSKFTSGQIRELSSTEKPIASQIQKVIRGETKQADLADIPSFVSSDGKERTLIFDESIAKKIQRDHGDIVPENLVVNANDWDYVIKNVDGNADKINLIKKVPDSENYLTIGANKDNGFFTVTHYETVTKDSSKLKNLLKNKGSSLDRTGRAVEPSFATTPKGVASQLDLSGVSNTSKVSDNGVKVKKLKTPEGLPKIPEKRIGDVGGLKQQIEQKSLERNFIRNTIKESPERQSAKYANKKTGELPEVTGEKGKGIYKQSGDDIASQHGFESSEAEREAFGGRYKKLKESEREASSVVRELKSKKAEQGALLEALRNQVRERKALVKAIEDTHGLDGADTFRVAKNRDYRQMSETTFNEFTDNLEKEGIKAGELRQARNELGSTIQEKELKKWENVKDAMKLPPISKMDTKQLNQLNEVLSQYKTGDEFLPTRQLETIGKTELKGLKTTREVQEFLAKKYNLTSDQMPGIKPHPWMYDTQLARQHPLYNLLVQKYNEAYLKSTGRVIEIEKEVDTLVKEARASVKGGISEKIAPTDKNIVKWLESDTEGKSILEKSMTKQEITASRKIDNVFHEYYDWLVKRSTEEKFSSRFEDKYFPHVRRGFLEAWKEDGFMKSFKEAFDQFKQEEKLLTILDEKTGDVLPYEKWVGFSQFRSGNLTPTQNVSRAFKSYVTSLEKARQFDEFIPEIMTYVHSLTPRNLTERGIEMDDSIKRFVKSWINAKKGRVEKQIIKPGSKMDWALRMGVALTRIRDLGINIPVGIANIFGEQAGNLTMLGAQNYSKGLSRLASSKGLAITKKYENFVGESLFAKLSKASNTAGDQLLGGIFGVFSASSRKGNQIFLLGSMTPAEFAKGEISLERLASLRNDMGKYRVVEGAESIFGKSVEGAIGGQYKKWAIPILTSTKDNALKLAELVRTRGVKEALSSNEGSQLFYSVMLGSAVGLGINGYYTDLKNKDDKNFAENIVYKTARDSLSMIGALDPKFIGSFAAPRLSALIVDISTAISDILFMEKYKTTGEFKGVEELKRTLTPTIVSSMIGKEQKTTEKKPKQLNTPTGLPKLPSVKKSLPTPQGLPKLPKL